MLSRFNRWSLRTSGITGYEQSHPHTKQSNNASIRLESYPLMLVCISNAQTRLERSTMSSIHNLNLSNAPNALLIHARGRNTALLHIRNRRLTNINRIIAIEEFCDFFHGRIPKPAMLAKAFTNTSRKGQTYLVSTI